MEISQNSLLVYKKQAGEEFLEEIKFDDKTLFLNIPYGWPREYIHSLSLSKKVRVKVGWRQPENTANSASVSDYVAAYINIVTIE